MIFDKFQSRQLDKINQLIFSSPFLRWIVNLLIKIETLNVHTVATCMKYLSVKTENNQLKRTQNRFNHVRFRVMVETQIQTKLFAWLRHFIKIKVMSDISANISAKKKNDKIKIIFL
jgi:hypothetical protein